MTATGPSPNAAAQVRLERALQGFAVDESTRTDTWAFTGSSSLDSDVFRIPRILQWLFMEIVRAQDGGRWEKTAWRFWFEFDGLPFSVAFEKCGLRIYGSAVDEKQFVTAVSKVVKALDRAVRIAEHDVFQSFADVQMRAGSVTIRNEFPRMRHMYEHFRSAAESGVPEHETRKNDERSLTGGGVHIFLEAEHRFHYTVAMLTAYFGWLEHALVLFWPFFGYQPGTDDLERFIGDRWGDKFKRLFDPAVDPTAKAHYDKVKATCEEFRNTFAHGGFGKHRRNLLVHVPGGGPIQAGVSWVRGRPHFDFFPVPEDSFTEIVDVLDSFDKWLQFGPAEYAWKWGESGLDLPCDTAYIQEINEVISAEDDSEFERLMSKWSYFAVRAANMDW